MFSVNWKSPVEGNEEIYPAVRVSKYKIDGKWQIILLLPGEPVSNVTLDNGTVYVMNGHGATVATYYMDRLNPAA